MSFVVTDNANNAALAQNKKPSLVLEIDGLTDLYTLSSLVRYTRVGDVGLYVDGSWVIGGTTPDLRANSYISIDGTTNSISQQLQQDKGGATSISSIQVSLIDYRQQISELVSPGFTLTDIMGRKAWVWLGFQGTLFPEDHFILFAGVIDEVSAAGTITLNIAHPETIKRQEIFVKATTALNGGINNAVTTITVDDVSEFLLPYSTEFYTYVKIDDEIIRYTGVDLGLNQLTGCTRGEFGTIAILHDDDADVASMYRLVGQSNDLALKVLLSGPNDYYLEDLPIGNFVRSADATDITDSIFIPAINVEEKYGLTVGDFITTTGASNGANNVSLETVSGIDITTDGSIITCTGAGFVLEIGTSALMAIKSKYNVLPDGCGLGGDRVDVPQFEDIDTAFNSYMPDMDFYLHDTVKAKDFVDKEILYPANMFTLPRKGKISAGYISPPLAISSLARIDSSNVVQPEKITIKRSLGRYFYNTIIYRYDFDAVETSRPLAGYVRVDENSKAQIPVGTKSLIISSQGLRNTTDTTTKLDILSVRAIDRYKFVAEMINVSVFYSIGYRIEVGDVVYFGDENLNILDTKNGQRGFSPRLCEVIDKKMNIFTGRVDLVLVDTNYLSDGRYGIFSPASIIGVGSTATELVLTQSYGTEVYELEKSKWESYIGQPILIRNNDWSTTYDSVLRGFDPADPTIMLIDDIGASVAAGFFVEIAAYPLSSDPEYARLLKSVHCFFDPTIAVTGGSSQTVFTVGGGDVSKLFVGCTVQLHNADFTEQSSEVKVTDITGTTITVGTALGFTPSASHDIELIGFSADAGSAYRLL